MVDQPDSSQPVSCVLRHLFAVALATLVSVLLLQETRSQYPEPSPAKADAQPRPARAHLAIETVLPPAPNRPDEPYRKDFSVEAAVRFLDQAVLSWHKERKCFACHSGYVYLSVRPAFSLASPAHNEIRAALEHVAEHPRQKLGSIGVTEAVMAAGVLASNDAATSGRLHPTTRKALDRMWTLQRDDGVFPWLKNAQPPSEIDDGYGVVMAAIGTGIAPEGYARTPHARAGLDKIRGYLREHPAAHLHDGAMRLLASRHVDGIMTQPECRQVVDAFRKLQKDDGGWGLATFGPWKRCDGTPQDTSASDGYGTGFAIYVLRQADIPSDDASIQRGLAWLKTHQRQSGRWFTRSLWKDQKHYLSYEGTAWALAALAACGENKR